MPSTKFAPVTHCIFDMDGTLLNTEHIYEGAIIDIAKKYGKEFPMHTRLRLLGTTEQMLAEIAVHDMELPLTAPEFREILNQLLRERLHDVPLMPGAARLLRHLHKHNIPIALATSSSSEMGAVKMTNHRELFDFFHHKVFGSSDPDVVNGKPAPDIFVVTAKRFPDQPPGKSCLVFEDAPNGVRGARLAGMQTVLVPEKFVADEQREEATLVLDSLEDFRPEMFGLPAFHKVCKMPLKDANA